MSINVIKELSLSMLVASKSADWDLLTGLERQRDILMRRFFEGLEPGADNVLEIKSGIAKVLEIDQEISVLCRAEADDCQRQLAGFKQGRKAVAAYVANTN